MKPKVSIIIPSFNSKDFIKATLDSVSNQTYTNIEIIVIDDHSTDGSFQYIESIKDEHIILEKNISKGPCAARNYGFQLSTGDYIQYLDADDILSPNKLEAQLKLAEVYGKETLYSCQWFHFKETVEDAIIKPHYIGKDYKQTYEWLNDSWLGKGMGQTSIWLTHRDVIVSSGGWDESLNINQDGEFFARVMFNVNEIVFSKDAFVYYRTDNASSISQSNKFSKKKAESLLKSYILYKKHAITYNAVESVKEGLANNFLTYIYRYHNLLPELAKQAESEFKSLGYKKMWPVGGKRFKQLASIIGFKNALILKKRLQ